ncbi:hypothetical protein WJX75_007855 [Coccomyxa subellipsoidea]|uniref:ERCC1-like central domain-containing protein n=1 Tax=Coccomyxa subellipsoidea TaxID=248742 RepID=A0ABR2Z1E8_9CHLO
MPEDVTPNPTKRRVIQLPSLQEVRAAERPAAPPSLFRPSSSGHQSSGPDYRPSRPPGPGTTSAVPPPSGDFGRPSYPVSAPPTLLYGPRHPQAPPSQQQINPNAVLVSKRQEGNPVLKHMRNVRWQFTEIVPDYQMGAQTCALFLSLRYHLLKPTYIYGRIKELQRAFRTRVLLCHVDVDDVVEPLAQVTKAALLNDCTLICAWSHEECARYLETYKAYESKPADAIQGRTEEDYLSKLTAALTTVRGVNKTDVLTLGGAFKTAAGVMRANMQQLSALPGIGPTKVRRLHETFHEPFRKTLRQSQLRLTPSTVAQGASLSASDVAAVQAPAESLPVDLVTPLDPGQDDEELADDLD